MRHLLLLFALAVAVATAGEAVVSGRRARLDAEAARGERLLPGTMVRWHERTDPDNARVIVDEAVTVCRRWPGLKPSLVRIESHQRGWPGHHALAFAGGRGEPGRYSIEFHAERWDGDRLAEAKRVTNHELGHTMEFLCEHQGLEESVYALFNRRSKGDFNKVRRAYEADPKGPGRADTYDKVFHRESEYWADAFQQSRYGRDDWYTREQRRLIREAGGERKPAPVEPGDDPSELPQVVVLK